MGDKQLNTDPSKGTNKYKFQSFAERLNGAKINVTHRVGQVVINPEDADSFFMEALMKWKELNCTKHFAQFCCDVNPLIGSFHLLVYNQQKVVQIILRHLQVPHSMASEVLLDLLTQLARDLRLDFYPNFKDVFVVLVSLLSDVQNVDLITNTFTALSYLFKFLSKYLVRDIDEVFSYYLDLLAEDQRPHVRQFAAESFSFLLRKVPVANFGERVDAIFTHLHNHSRPEFIEGLGALLFETVKGTTTQFHSKAPEVYRIILDRLNQPVPTAPIKLPAQVSTDPMEIEEKASEEDNEVLLDNTTDSDMRERIMSVLQELNLRMVKHTRKENCVFVWDVLLAVTETFSAELANEVVKDLLTSAHQSAEGVSQTIDLMVAVMTTDMPGSVMTAGSRLFPLCLANTHCQSKPSYIYHIWDGLMELGIFAQMCLPYIVKHVSSLSLTGVEGRENLIELMSFMIRLVKTVDLNHVMSSVLSPNHRMIFPSPTNSKEKCIADCLLDILTEEKSDASNLSLVWAAVECVQWVEVDVAVVMTAMKGLIQCMLELSSNDQFKEGALHMIGVAMVVMVRLHNDKPSQSANRRELWPLFLDLLMKFPDNTHILGGFSDYISALPEDCKDLTGTENLEKVFPVFKENLSSPLRSVRLHTFTLLAKFTQFNLLPSQNQDKNRPEPPQPCVIFELGRESEEIPVSLELYRDRIVVLKKMASLATFNRLPEFYQEVVVRYMMGMLYVNFKLLWEPVMEILAGECSRDTPLFWGLILAQIQKVAYLTGPNAPNEAQPVEISAAGEVFAEKYMASLRPDKERMDHRHYYTSLLNTLQKVPAVVEKYSRQLLPIFFEFLEREHKAIQLGKADLQDLRAEALPVDVDLIEVDEDDDVEGPSIPRAKKDPAETLGRRNVKQKLLDYLRLFGLFMNPRVLFRGDEVHALEMELLANTDREIQRAALKCLIGYKTPGIQAHKETVENLLEEDKFRDALAKHNMSEVKPEHHADLMGVMGRILYAHMMSRKGAGSNKNSVHTRRATALGFMAGCNTDDLKVFIDFISEPFISLTTLDDWQASEGVDLTGVIPLAKQLGFLNLLPDLLKQLRFLLLPFLPSLMSIAVRITADAVWLLENQRTAVNPKLIGQLRNIRMQGMKSLATVFNIMPDVDFTSIMQHVVDSIVSPRIQRLASESLQHSSGLLEIFAVWSRHRSMASALVSFDKSILPNIYSCLAAPGVAQGVVNRVHDIVESLLHLKEEEDKEDNAIPANQKVGDTVVAPYMEELLNCMHAAIFSKGSSNDDRGKSWSHRELSLLSRISPYATNQDSAEKLLVLLMPYLRTGTKKVNDDTRVSLLGILRSCLRLVPATQSHLSFLAQLFGSLGTKEARIALVEVYKEMAAKVEEIQPVVGLLEKLNAYDQLKVEEFDYDTRLEAYTAINEDLVNTLSVTCLLPITHNHLYIIATCEDLSLRTSAVYGMLKIGKRAQAEKEAGNSELFDELVQRITIPAMKKAMKSNKEFARHEFLGLINNYIGMFPESALGEMKCLCDDDDDANFFVNVRHIQLHRRIRALNRLAKDITSGLISQAAIMNFLMPLLTHVIFENIKPSEHHLVQEAINTIAAMTGSISWGHYIRTLRNFLRLVASRPKLEKPLLKAVVAVVHSFHFDVQTTAFIAPADTEEQVEEDVEEEKAVIGEEEIEKQAIIHQRIMDTLLNTLIPDMYKYLIKKDGDKKESLRPPVALGIVRLLQALPIETLHLELPKLITKVVTILKIRDDETREDARETLLKMLDLLGPSYLSFILNELKAILNKGYQLHILGFTTHALLTQALAAGLPPAEVDQCLKVLLEILIQDIFGRVAEEKNVVAIAGKMKEAKAKKGPESYELVARAMSFKQLYNILMPLRDIMVTTEDSKVVKTIEDVMKHIVVGVTANPTADIPTILQVVHSLVSENSKLSRMATKEAAKKTKREHNYHVQALSTRETKRPASYYLQTHAHMFVEFGMNLLYSNIKRGRIEGSNQEHLQMLDPLVAMLSDQLKSKYDKVVMQSLRCLSFCFRYKLPTLEVSVPHLAVRCFKLLNRAGVGSISSEMHQASFKLLTTIIRDYPSYHVPEDHLRHLLSVAKTDLEATERQSSTFSMLRAIVARKLVVPEVYDLMTQVSEMAVRSTVSSTRTMSVQIFTTYLLDYPLGERLLKKHLEFVVRNLDYEHRTGRESALELIRQTVELFPWDVLVEYIQFFFVPLVMMLVNDEDPQCREMAGIVIKSLINRANPLHQDKLIGLTLTWLSSDNLALKRAALQVTGLFVEVMGSQFERHVVVCLPLLCAEISKDTQENADDEEGEDDSVMQGNWPILYYSLTTLYKLCTAMPKIMEANSPHQRQLMELWTHIHLHLLYPHAWVRLVASRVLGVYLSACNYDRLAAKLTGSISEVPSTKNAAKQPAGDYGDYLCEEGKTMGLAKSCCHQLESRYLSADLGTQIVKNLIFLSKLLDAMDGLQAPPPVAALPAVKPAQSKLIPETTGAKKRNRGEDESDEEEEGEGDGVIDEEEEDAKDSMQEQKGNLLGWVVRRLAYLARSSDADVVIAASRRQCVFEYFAALTSHLGVRVNWYLATMLSPLYRVTESLEQDNLGPEELAVKEFAQELLDMLQKVVGTTAYVTAFNSVRKHVAALRQERKKRRAME
eukprot:Ihof_evm2s341 gene=Ihof_evmTU2s341